MALKFLNDGYFAGKVGIGTASPDTLLNLEGAKNTSIITLGSTTNNASWSIGDKYGAINFYSADSSGAGAGVKASISYEVSAGATGATNALVFNTAGTVAGTNNTERMRIASTGNVGIGTTSPVGKLYVGPTWTQTGGDDLYIKDQSSTTSYDPSVTNTQDLGITYNASSTTTTGPDKVGLVLHNDAGVAGDFSPMMIFSGREATPSQYKAAMAGIYARSPLGTGNSDSWIDGELIFATAGAATRGIVQRMVINKEGNVGIGTTTPTNNANRTTLTLNNNTWGGQYELARIGVVKSKWSWGTGASTIFGTTVAEPLQFVVNGAARLTLDSSGDSYFNSGNVGIGTTDPNVKLRIAGTQGNPATSGSTSTGFLSLYTGTHGLMMGVQGASPWGSWIQAQDKTNHAINYNLLLNPNGGNVGIGTNGPATHAKLTVMGNQTFGIPGNGSNTSGRFLSIEGNADNIGEASSRIFFSEHNQTAAAQDAYGMSLGYRGGSGTITGASGANWTGLSLLGNGQWGMWGHNNNSTGALIMYGDRAATFVNFSNNNIQGINNGIFSGNVGISTTGPSEKLEVVGNSYTRGKTRGKATNYATSEGWEASANVNSAVGYFGGDFMPNGGSAENKLEYDLGPFGDRELIWKTIPELANNSDGGWDKTLTTLPGVAGKSAYMSIVYVKRPTSAIAGTFYHGCDQSNTLNLNGSANTNPYFISGLPQANLPENVWCVSIGIIQANNDANTASSSLGGVYRLDTGAKIQNAITFKQKATLTQKHRAYHYYSPSTTAKLEFARPGFYVIDGSEPTLSELTFKPTAGSVARTGQGSTTTAGVKFWSGTQAQYDALTPDANTIYYVT